MKTKYWALIYFSLLIVPVCVCGFLAMLEPLSYIFMDGTFRPFSSWLTIGVAAFAVELITLTFLLGSRVFVSEEERS